jgi:hypothetical protein
MGKRDVVGSMSEWAGMLSDFFRQIKDGSITLEMLGEFNEHRNPFASGIIPVKTFADKLISKTAKLLSKWFGKKITVDPLPAWFTLENLAKAVVFNLRPVFFPDEEISENRLLRNWVKPGKWFYQKINEGKIAVDSAKLRRGWYLADFSVGVDYNDGIQVFPDDPLVPIIARLREEKKVGKYEKTPMDSRFAIVPKDEWPLVLAEITKDLGLKPEQLRLERAIEFNAIGNLYDKNRGKFNCWDWFTDNFEDSDWLFGGHRGYGGMADVYYDSADNRRDDSAGRPLVSF